MLFWFLVTCIVVLDATEAAAIPHDPVAGLQGSDEIPGDLNAYHEKPLLLSYESVSPGILWNSNPFSWTNDDATCRRRKSEFTLRNDSIRYSVLSILSYQLLQV